MLIKVLEIGTVCVYCGTETKDACCGEVHHETGYIEVDKNLEEIGHCVILESELSKEHKIIYVTEEV